MLAMTCLYQYVQECVIAKNRKVVIKCLILHGLARFASDFVRACYRQRSSYDGLRLARKLCSEVCYI